MKTVVREAIKKYKRNAVLSAIPPEVPALPSLLAAATKANHAIAGKNRNRNVPKKYIRQKKGKVLTDITDMYAVGLRLTK